MSTSWPRQIFSCSSLSSANCINSYQFTMGYSIWCTCTDDRDFRVVNMYLLTTRYSHSGVSPLKKKLTHGKHMKSLLKTASDNMLCHSLGLQPYLHSHIITELQGQETWTFFRGGGLTAPWWSMVDQLFVDSCRNFGQQLLPLNPPEYGQLQVGCQVKVESTSRLHTSSAKLIHLTFWLISLLNL